MLGKLDQSGGRLLNSIGELSPAMVARAIARALPPAAHRFHALPSRIPHAPRIGIAREAAHGAAAAALLRGLPPQHFH